MTNLSVCPGAVCQHWANHNSLRSIQTNYQKKWKMDTFWLWILITFRSDFSIFLVIKNLKPNIKFLKKSLIKPIKLSYSFPWDAEAAFSWFFQFHHFVSFPDLLLLNWRGLVLFGLFVCVSLCRRGVNTSAELEISKYAQGVENSPEGFLVWTLQHLTNQILFFPALCKNTVVKSSHRNHLTLILSLFPTEGLFQLLGLDILWVFVQPHSSSIQVSGCLNTAANRITKQK